MAITDHLASGATTLSYCWVIERVDGTVIGVTDHDEDVTVDGYDCSSADGMVTTRFEQSLGLVSDDLEIEGVITDEAISSTDLRAGNYDNATVKLYLVNWADPTEFLHMATGKFGQIVETDGEAFSVEFLSRSHDLQQPVGRTYQRTCDTKLGSSRCGINLLLPIYRTTTTVVSVTESTMVVADLSGYDDDWFTMGTVTVNDHEVGIRRHTGETLELWREPDVTIDPGDTVLVITGCKQDATTCLSKFDNILNFQGFKLMPGNDSLTDYPVRGQDDYDGGSLFL